MEGFVARLARAAAAGAAILILITTTGAATDTYANIERGRDIAEGRCGRCHAVGRDDPSPQRMIIPFRELQSRYPVAMLIDALRTGSISGHDEMPGFDLGLADAKALLTYIDSFAPDRARYVPALKSQ